MNPALILAGISMACIVQMAPAEPASFSLQVVPQSASQPGYSTLAAPIGNGMMAALIPYKIFKNGGVSYHLGDKNSPPLTLCAQERLTGLTIFKLPPGMPKQTAQTAQLAPPNTLKQGNKLTFANNKQEPTHGLYIGMEHALGEISFPLRLIRAHFPNLALPAIGQPCYDDKGRLVGIVLGVSRKGTCHLLPARAIDFLAKNPDAKRVRIGCLMDVNSCTPVIEGIINSGPLARCGVQTGDILIRINDTPIRHYGDMLDATYYMTGKQPLSLKVIRGTQMIDCHNVMPTLDER